MIAIHVKLTSTCYNDQATVNVEAYFLLQVHCCYCKYDIPLNPEIFMFKFFVSIFS